MRFLTSICNKFSAYCAQALTTIQVLTEEHSQKKIPYLASVSSLNLHYWITTVQYISTVNDKSQLPMNWPQTLLANFEPYVTIKMCGLVYIYISFPVVWTQNVPGTKIRSTKFCFHSVHSEWPSLAASQISDWLQTFSFSYSYLRGTTPWYIWTHPIPQQSSCTAVVMTAMPSAPFQAFKIHLWNDICKMLFGASLFKSSASALWNRAILRRSGEK